MSPALAFCLMHTIASMENARHLSAIWRVMQIRYDCSAAADETGCHIHRLRRDPSTSRTGTTPTMHTAYFTGETTDIQFETASIPVRLGVEIRRDPSASAALPCRVGRIFA